MTAEGLVDLFLNIGNGVHTHVRPSGFSVAGPSSSHLLLPIIIGGTPDLNIFCCLDPASVPLCFVPPLNVLLISEEVFVFVVAMTVGFSMNRFLI